LDHGGDAVLLGGNSLWGVPTDGFDLERAQSIMGLSS
jgi:hypothetical protein